MAPVRLDVYKRQGCRRRIAEIFHISYHRLFPGLNIYVHILHGFFGLLDPFIPVSYTHLCLSDGSMRIATAKGKTIIPSVIGVQEKAGGETEFLFG